MDTTAYEQQGLYKRIKGRHGDYETRRQKYDAQRNVIAELLRPDLVHGETGQKDEGAFGSSKIVEGTGPHAARVWQRGFVANLVSRKQEWFREAAKDPPRAFGVSFKGNDEVNQWLQDLAEHMADIYRRSNYYEVLPQFTLDGGTVGSPAMLYEQDIAHDRMVCKVPDYASVYIDKDIFGEDNALHVVWEWTALDAMQFFGKEQLPRAVQEQLRNGQHYAKTKYLQAIYGSGDPIYQGVDSVPTGHAWLEHFICLGASGEPEEKVLKPLHKGPGYFSRPFSTWHYHRNWHEVYGKTMGWWAIYDVKGLNSMWEAIFGDAELSLRPPSWAMQTLRGLLNLGPGGDNWARSEEEFDRPPQFLERKTRYDVAIDFADRITQSVQRHFHYQFFMAINQIIASKSQPETAYGLQRAQAENGVQLVEEIESFEQQVLGHTHDVFMAAELAAQPAYPWGRLPQPPQILLDYSDGKVDVEFIGPLSMLQVNDRQIDRFYRAMGPAELIFNASPETINKVRWPDVLEWLLEAQNFPQSHIVSQEDYETIIEGVRQRAMQQEMAESMPKMAQGVKSLQGKTEKGSPLAMLTGGKA